jgi:hypothetical protein
MPTAAKLFAGFSFMLVAFFAAQFMRPAFPEGYNLTYFSIICAVIGLLVGWIVMGSLAGRGALKAMMSGLRTSITILFWCLVVFSIWEMILRSVARRYDGVFEAIEATFEIAYEYLQYLQDAPNTIGMLVLGGIMGGLFANWAAVRWS